MLPMNSSPLKSRHHNARRFMKAGQSQYGGFE
jgi:hypothetical protein